MDSVLSWVINLVLAFGGMVWFFYRAMAEIEQYQEENEKVWEREGK